MIARKCVLTLCLFLSLPALSAPPAETDVRGWALEYFDRYAARDDWPGFLAQFDNDLAFEDPIAGYQFETLERFTAFYNWPDPGFSKHPDYPETLVLDELIVVGNRSIGVGHFTPFQWQGSTYGDTEPMQFTIWLEWNNEGKITRQVDWIDYPPALLRAMYCPTE